ncbi:hypothetical protein RF11_09411 [Thelohanellus kitauei]|uniref:Uncharacterized protein n=1 Tax=Thelohanellus kitauei TaxID=669202 RepID=A0A0C2IUY0_THEKT|nr:hypothetical protein RF11_09411 [Thelohanellus kitauei]
MRRNGRKQRTEQSVVLSKTVFPYSKIKINIYIKKVNNITGLVMEFEDNYPVRNFVTYSISHLNKLIHAISNIQIFWCNYSFPEKRYFQLRSGYIPYLHEMATPGFGTYRYEVIMLDMVTFLRITETYLYYSREIIVPFSLLDPMVDTLTNIAKQHNSPLQNDDFAIRITKMQKPGHLCNNYPSRFSLAYWLTRETSRMLKHLAKFEMQVLSDPKPMNISVDKKVFLFQLVMGNRPIIRITEIDSGIIKSNVMIPMESINKFLADMNSKVQDLYKKQNLL